MYECDDESLADEVRSLCLSLDDNDYELLDQLRKILFLDIYNNKFDIQAYKQELEAYEEELDDYKEELEERISIRVSEKEEELNEIFEERVMDEVAMLARNKFLIEKMSKDMELRNDIFNKIKEDIVKSKKESKYPFLYEETLGMVSEDELIAFLLKDFYEEVLTEYKTEIIEAIIEENKDYLLHQALIELKKDKKLMDELEKKARIEITNKLFD